MPTYCVTIPITGCASVEVEAEDEVAAEDAAYTALGEMDLATLQDHLEWEYTPHVTEGNVTYAMMNDIEIQEI